MVPPAARLWGHTAPRSRAASWHVRLRWLEETALQQEKGTRLFALWHQLPPGSDHVTSSRVIGNGAESSNTAVTSPTAIRKGRPPFPGGEPDLPRAPLLFVRLLSLVGNGEHVAVQT